MRLFIRFRKTCLLATGLLWFAGLAAFAQVPSWRTVVPMDTGSSGYSWVQGSCTDANGDLYVVGQFNGTATFGPTVLSSPVGYQLFVAKWETASARFRWAVQGGAGSLSTTAAAVAVAGTRVYVTGFFSGPTARFGTTTLSHPSSGATTVHLVLARLTDAGNSAGFDWAVGTQTDANDIYPGAIAVNGPNVYVTGQFGSPVATFGSLSLTNANGGLYPTNDSFVAKLTDTGTGATYDWLQQAGGPANEAITAVACHGSSVYIGGYFGSNVCALGPYSLVQTSANDLFVAKITDSGRSSSFAWVNRASCTGNSGVLALRAVANEVYLGGFMCGTTAQFGPHVLTNAGPVLTSDAFVVKLTDDGLTSHYSWAQQGGGVGNEQVSALAVQDSSVFITGPFDGRRARFGSTTLVNTPPAPGNQGGTMSDVFVAQLPTRAGRFGWVQSAGGSGNEYPYTISAAGPQLWIGGAAGSQARFGALTLGNYSGGGFMAALGAAPLSSAGAASQQWVPVVSPNPATGLVTVWLPAAAGSAAVALTLTNALGQVVLARSVRLLPVSTVAPLDVTGLASGVYSMRLTGGPQAAVCRLVVR